MDEQRLTHNARKNLTKKRQRNIINEAKIKLLLRQLPIAIFLSLLVTIFVYIELHHYPSPYVLNVWFGSMIGLSLILIGLPLFFLKYKIYRNLSYTVSIITILMMCLGILWGTIGYVFINETSIFQQAYIIMIVFGLAAGAMPVLSIYIQMYLLFCIPVLVPFIIWLALNPDFHMVWTLSASIYLLVVVGSSYYMNLYIGNFLNLKSANFDLDMMNRLLNKKVDKRTEVLNKTLALLQSTLESTADGILVIDTKGKGNYFNQQLLNMWGAKGKEKKLMSSADQLISFIKSQLINPYPFLKTIVQLRKKPHDIQRDEIKLKNQKIFEWYSSPYWVDNHVSGRVWNFRDITERKRMEARLSYQANHDFLTHLPNQRLLKKHLLKLAAVAKRFNHYLVALFIDVNNFKIINDNFGYEAGDEIIKIIAQRLKRQIRKADTIARFGSDEFVILLVTENLQNIYDVSMKLLGVISKPIQYKQHKLLLTGKIGASVYPLDHSDPNKLLRNASVALNHAKHSGGKALKIYEPHLDMKNKNVLEVQAGILAAIQNHQMFMEYQPIVDLKSLEIVSAEALCRWRHVQGNTIYPANFISIAEQTGLIVELGEHIFNLVCEQTHTLFTTHTSAKPFKMAINISVLQLQDPYFPQKISRILTNSGLRPENVQIEITETTMMENKGEMIDILNQMHETGFEFVIDDFGMGYSSLGYLKNLPISKIKIDRSFINDCYWDGQSASIVKTILHMAHELSIPVVAEGIELKEQLDFLIENHCDQGQGFLLSPPVSYEKFEKLLANKTIKLK